MKTVLLECTIVAVVAASKSSYKTKATDQVLVTCYGSEMALYKHLEGSLEEEDRWSVPEAITWVVQGSGSLWAIHEVSSYEGEEGGAISRWEMENGRPALREWQSTGIGPAHLLVDLEHNLLLTSNYGGGTLSVFSITSNGTLGSLVQTEQYGNGCRDLSHPHQTVRRGEWVWLVDLGCDTVWHYRVVEGRLEQAGETIVDAGAGPRHMALHPTRNLAFLACELKSLMNVYTVDEMTGALTLVQQLPFASSESHAGAEILVTEDGSMVYASSRGLPQGIIVAYRVVGDMLERVQETFLIGTWPRSMTIQGDIMLVADQKGDSVQFLRINSTGHLVAETQQLTATPPQPAYITFL